MTTRNTPSTREPDFSESSRQVAMPRVIDFLELHVDVAACHFQALRVPFKGSIPGPYGTYLFRAPYYDFLI